MIVETALFTVRDGDQALFSRTFASARRFIETAKGFRKLEMHQGIEAPDTFILIVWWETLEDHPSRSNSRRTSPDGGPRSATFSQPRRSCAITPSTDPQVGRCWTICAPWRQTIAARIRSFSPSMAMYVP
jgi:hypothetical protein